MSTKGGVNKDPVCIFLLVAHHEDPNNHKADRGHPHAGFVERVHVCVHQTEYSNGHLPIILEYSRV